MSQDENNRTEAAVEPEPSPWLSPKAQYAAQEQAEYDPFDVFTLADEPC